MCTYHTAVVCVADHITGRQPWDENQIEKVKAKQNKLKVQQSAQEKL